MSGFQLIDLPKVKAALTRRRTVLVAVLVAISLIVTGFVGAYKKVVIVADGATVSLSTIYSQPGDVLAQARISLGPQDEYRSSTPKITDGTVIEVYRAVPVTVVCKGKTETVVTGKPSVGELAVSLGYLPETARTIPGEATRITAGMQVRIVSVAYKTEVRRGSLPAPVMRQPEPNLEVGEEEVVAAGEDGVREATVKLRLEDGQEVSSEVLAEQVIIPPKPQVIKVGTRDTVQTSRGTMRFSRVCRMEATAYLPTDGSSAGLTASGIPARRGIVAVDPDVIPLGSRVFVPGYGLALAADVGGAVLGNRIDLCMESPGEAWSFGRRMVKVYVIAN